MTDYIFYQPRNDGDYQLIEGMLSWAEQHCPSYVTNDVVCKYDGDFYRLYFGQEKDFSWFTLRWS